MFCMWNCCAGCDTSVHSLLYCVPVLSGTTGTSFHLCFNDGSMSTIMTCRCPWPVDARSCLVAINNSWSLVLAAFAVTAMCIISKSNKCFVFNICLSFCKVSRRLILYCNAHEIAVIQCCSHFTVCKQLSAHLVSIDCVIVLHVCLLVPYYCRQILHVVLLFRLIFHKLF